MEAQPQKKPNDKRPKTWVLLPVILILIVFSYFFRDVNTQNSNVNHENYRLLYESSEQLNNNLNKLKRAHQNGENTVAIRALFPSYKAISEGKEAFKSVRYKLLARRLVVINQHGKEIAELNIDDVLPTPNTGFSKYLFADDYGQVVATFGNENKLAFSNLAFLKKAFSPENSSVFAKLSKTKSTEDRKAELPTHSSHVDINLAHGNYRVYVYPFSLSVELLYRGSVEDKSQQTALLFLIGFVEDVELSKRAISKWNVPIIVISVLSILVLVSIVRLYLQPKNQFSTNFYRYFVVITCNLAFLATIALLLSTLEAHKLEKLKATSANEYIINLQSKFNDEIIDKFEQLNQYRAFYKSLYFHSFYVKNGASSSENFTSKLAKTISSKAKSAVFVDLKAAKHPLAEKESCDKPYLPTDQKCVLALQESKFETCTTGKELSSSEFPLALIVAGNDKKLLTKQLACFSETIDRLLSASNGGQHSVALTNPILNVNQKLAKEGKIEVSIDAGQEELLKDGIISTLLINKHGNTAPPTLFYREVSSIPRTFSLAHRQYFKSVRDQQGWEIRDSDGVLRFSNVYIQRLRNMNNGTTGTTISMPLISRDSGKELLNDELSHDAWAQGQQEEFEQQLKSAVLIADVFFEQISTFNTMNLNAKVNKGELFNEQLKLLNADFIHMVVDRNTGQVLFHSQNERSLNENIFYSGNSQRGLTEWLMSASQSLDNGADSIAGQYHGKVGKFYIKKTVVDEWALVVFVPDELQVWFMTNQFIYYLISALVLMSLFTVIIKGYVKWQQYKTAQVVIARGKQRELFFWASCLTSFLIIQVGLLSYVNASAISSGLLLGVFSITFLVITIKKYHKQSFILPSNFNLTYFSAVMIVVVLIVFQISIKSGTSLQGVALQSKNMICATQNSKRQELEKKALSLFPNSIMHAQYPAIEALGIDSKSLTSSSCLNASVTPGDFPNYATAKGNKQLWGWLKTYMLPSENIYQTEVLDSDPLFSLPNQFAWYLLIFASLILVVACSWRLIHTRILWTLLYFDRSFLRHIAKLAKDTSEIDTDNRSTQLEIIGDNVKLNGIELDLQIKQAQKNRMTNSFQQLINSSPLIEGLVREELSTETDNGDDKDRLVQKCNQINMASYFPNLKLDVNPCQGDGKADAIAVEIWDVETCLEHKEQRKLLLALIMEIKGLVLSGDIASFKIYSGFHCLQRVALKDAMEFSENETLNLERIEYLSWSECLMDFNFKLMKSYDESIDCELLRSEVEQFPELKSIDALANLINDPSKEVSHSLDCKWATINLILVHAEAFYRFKWELCSNAEKLALFNLAKSRFLNPSNCQMIEHLAMNGLIRVENERICLINESFTYFVLNAEPPETMGKLFRLSEQGVWKNNKAIILLSIVFILVSIAYFSGESLLIVFGSIAGVLTTLATITNSANLIRSHFK